MYSSYILLFFFSCSGHPRDLHSFPTRRSSDLHVSLRRRVAFSPGDPCGVHLPTEPRRIHPTERGAGRRDRKSTRLNSSHTVISYAVFCLKKKSNRNAADNRTYNATSLSCDAAS